MAAMKNVLSPISDTMITEREATKACMKPNFKLLVASSDLSVCLDSVCLDSRVYTKYLIDNNYKILIPTTASVKDFCMT